MGITIFTVMSQMAEQYGAINLSQGFPTYSTPSKLVEYLQSHLKIGKHQYAPMAGILPLREGIAAKMKSFQQVDIHPDTEITITSGATEALWAAISAVVNKGDEVIVLEPAYDSYVPAIQLNGGIPVFVSIDVVSLRIDWSKVEQAITPKTRAIIINTPHNPTGMVMTKDDLRELARIVIANNLFVISDEVYEHIVFDEHKHHSLCTNAELKERTFVISSFGKTYHITGWKIGYCIAPPKLTAEFRKIHQYLTFSTFHAAQWALADYLSETSFHWELAHFYQQKRDLFINGLKKTPFKFSASEGTFFQSISYEGLTDESDIILATRLVKEYGVACIPTSAFYNDGTDNKILRFCFAKEENVLHEALTRLQSFTY